MECTITNTLTILSYTPHSPFLPTRASTTLRTLYIRAATLVLGKWSTAEPDEVRDGILWKLNSDSSGWLPANVTVAGSSVTVNDVLKILGVALDSKLTFDDHANSVVWSCNYHLRALWHLPPCYRNLAASIVGSRLDYCNALFYGVTQSTMNKLQRVQNNLARVVCDVGWRHAHSADLLHNLHWLPVHKRVMFKAASLCYRSCRFSFSQLIPPLVFISTSDLYHVVMLWSSTDFASATPGWLIVICCRALINRSVRLVIAH